MAANIVPITIHAMCSMDAPLITTPEVWSRSA
jgi:hypothetical protein